MTKNKKIKIPSNRSFGIFFFIIFLIISIFPITNDKNIVFWSLILALIFLFLGIANSSLLSPLNKLWFKLGVLLGNLISPIVMSAIFFLVVTPIGILMRLIGKDLLKLKKNKLTKSYWIERNTKIKNKMKDQF